MCSAVAVLKLVDVDGAKGNLSSGAVEAAEDETAASVDDVSQLRRAPALASSGKTTL